MKRVTLILVIVGGIEGFLFDQLSNGLRCKGISMMCPPMCQVQDSQGCVSCDCSHIDPSHPKIPNSGSNSGHQDPSNPLSGHNTFPGSAGCKDWTNCACALSVNAETGCAECPCSNQQVSTIPLPTHPTTYPRQMSTNAHHTSKAPYFPSLPTNAHPTSTAPLLSTSSPVPLSSTSALSSLPVSSNITPLTSFTKYTTKPVTGNQSNASTRILPTKYAGTNPTQLPLSTFPMTSHSTSKRMTPATPPMTSAVSVFQTSSTPTSTSVDTNLPNIATVPSLNTLTSLITTSTLAPFVCPGVFSCALDCYAGFLMNKNGCPQCACAPIPTDLP